MNLAWVKDFLDSCFVAEYGCFTGSLSNKAETESAAGLWAADKERGFIEYARRRSAWAPSTAPKYTGHIGW